jgi:diphthine-ammonia ligase
MRLGVLFSGGKDSTFACYQASRKEEVVCLITVLPQNIESYMFHTPNIQWTTLQAEAIGLPLVSMPSAGEEEKELADLQRAIELARERFGIEGVVSGAIQSVYQASRIQRICNALGLWCFNPLWHRDPATYMEALLASGFEVMITGVFSPPLDEAWLGRRIDPSTLKELRRLSSTHGIALTGEGGEYETFILDGPLFQTRICVDEAHTEYRYHHGRYYIDAASLEKP